MGEFKAAIRAGLLAKEEVEARWFLASSLWSLANQTVSQENLLSSPQFQEGLREAELAVALDRSGGHGFFAQPTFRCLLQELDISYCMIGHRIEEEEGVDAAIKFCREKISSLDYLEPNPLLGLHLDLGVQYLAKRRWEDARNCFLAIDRAPTVDPVDEKGWERSVRQRAGEGLKEVVMQKKCFVATAVYGSESATEVQIFRRFRDEYLGQTAFGRTLVLLYYVVSPRLAAKLRHSERLRSVCRTFLKPCLGLARLMLQDKHHFGDVSRKESL